MNPMTVPPFASYKGTDTINGQECAIWDANFFGVIDLTYYVANQTNPDGKTIPECLRFIAGIHIVT
jgi:hypothetical protein